MNLFDAIFSEIPSSASAVLYERRQISYGLLQEQTLGMAQVLRSLDLALGERVAILLPDCPEFIASFISISSNGAIAVPINMALRPEEQEAILRDCTARVAIIEANHCRNLLTDAPETLRHLAEIIVVCLAEKDKLEFSAWHGERTFGESVRIRLLADLQRESNDIAPKFPSAEEASADQASGQDRPAFILYTSGSTGEPKGAIHSQEGIFYTNETFCKEVLRLSSVDRLFSSSRLPFAYGLGNSLTFPLLNGATTILCREKPTVEIIARVFRESRPTIFFAVPVVYNLLLDQQRRSAELDCSSLRLCISAGEALPAALGAEWEKTFGVPVLDGIGSTEMLHMFMSNQAGALRYGSSGKLLKGYEAQLRDDQDKLNATGAEGHLWVKGKSAAQGYWQRPQQTARTFVDGWVRTGDLYRCDSDGYWFHLGRGDDCFKSSGQWVSPVEVEGVLLHHPRIWRAAIVEDFDEAGLPCACAFVVCKDVESDFEIVEQDLRQLATESLPRFKRPRKYVFVKELPYTVTGKIQRFKLREQLRNEKSLQEMYAPELACFGCGPANEKGLHVRSFPKGTEVYAEWKPRREYEAFMGVLSGGIIGTLLDCHCNWTAAWHLMKKAGLAHPPCTVTADYTIKLLRPTPTDRPVQLLARVIESTDDRATVEGELIAHEKVCATCHGTFVAVKPGHPAYHRW